MNHTTQRSLELLLEVKESTPGGCGHTPVVLTPETWRPRESKFEAILGYKAESLPKGS